MLPSFLLSLRSCLPVARRLRTEHPAKKLYLIAVTGYSKDSARLSAAGFDDHLIKPPDLEHLAELIAAWVGVGDEKH